MAVIKVEIQPEGTETPAEGVPAGEVEKAVDAALAKATAERQQHGQPQQTIKLMPKQAIFVRSERKEILYSGAFGAGKTRALCYRAMRIAQEHPAARVGLTRKTMVSLKATTLVTLMQPDGDLPPVLPYGSYHYLKSPGEECITLKGGGSIIPFGCDNPQKVGSLQLTDCCVDEAIELDEEEWIMLLGRIRVRFTHKNGKENKRTIAAATNPGPPTHFLHERFYTNKTKDRHLIETSSLDNWYLAPDTIASYCTFTGAALKRYVCGEWCVFEGAVYPMFDASIHECHRPAYDWVRYVAGVDYGFKHPMVMRLHGVDGDGRSHVLSEFYKTGVTSDELIDVAKTAVQHYGRIMFIIDPSAAELRTKMKRANLSTRKANNDVMGGIQCVQNALTVAQDGKPRLTFQAGLEGTREYYSYRWRNSAAKDDPLKENDDACDADRYAMMEITRSGRTRRLTVSQQIKGSLEDRMFGPAQRITRPADRQKAMWVDVNNQEMWRN